MKKRDETIVFEASHLASRHTASQVRDIVMAYLSDESVARVVFDFSTVSGISSSYADELFGIIAEKIGKDAALKRLRVKNASKFTLKIIAECIKVRTGGAAAA